MLVAIANQVTKENTGLQAEVARLKAEMVGLNAEVSAITEERIIKSLGWKVEARWAADEVMTLMKSRAPAHILAQDPVYQRAQRILEG